MLFDTSGDDPGSSKHCLPARPTKKECETRLKLGCGVIDTLIKAGGLTVTTNADGQACIVELTIQSLRTVRQAYNAFCLQIAYFDNHEALKRHALVAKAFKIDPPYHHNVNRDLAKLMGLLMKSERLELRQLVPARDAQLSEVKKNVDARLKRPLERVKIAAGKREWQSLKELLPERLRSLPRTCLEPTTGHRYNSPDPEWAARAHAMDTFKALAALLLVILSAKRKKNHTITKLLKAVTLVDEILSKAGTTDNGRHDGLTECLSDYFYGREQGCGSAAYRAETISAFVTAVDDVRAFFRGRDYASLRADLDAIVPGKIVLDQQLSADMSDARSQATTEGHINRKTKTNPESATLTERLEACEARAKVMTDLGEAARDAMKKAFISKNYEDAFVEVETLDSRGLPTGGKQIEHIRVWPLELARQSLGGSEHVGADNVGVQRTDHQGTVPEDDEFPWADFAAEHIDTLSFGGGEPSETWMITIAKAQCLVDCSPLACSIPRCSSTPNAMKVSGSRPSGPTSRSHMDTLAGSKMRFR